MRVQPSETCRARQDKKTVIMINTMMCKLRFKRPMTSQMALRMNLKTLKMNFLDLIKLTIEVIS